MDPEELLEKLIKNQISREEFERLLEGMDNEEILARYEAYLLTQFENEIEKDLSDKVETPAVSKGYMQVTKPLTTKVKKDPRRSYSRSFQVTAIAASLAVFLVAALLLVFQVGPFNWDGNTAGIYGDSDLITKSTPTGRMFRMNLEDGSFIHMNAVSSITYPPKFGSNKREIEITGEAYFDIERDETRPFNIKVKDYNVRVLGTSFNIQAYEDEDDFSVTVESGKVKVILDEDGEAAAVLEKDQKLMYSTKTGEIRIIDVVSSKELNWRKGILHFDATPMEKVEKTLERWYGVDVVIANKEIYNRTLSGLHHNENLESVLEALSYATGTKYVIKGDSVIISKSN